jgi:uncharacterized protein YecT (DUF1311 family)
MPCGLNLSMMRKPTTMHHRSEPSATCRPAVLARCVAAWAVLACATSGHAAAPAKPAARADVCAGAANEVALLACRSRLQDQSMAAQQRLIDKLRKRLEADEPERLQLLLAAQAAYLQYRDAECRMRTFESRSGSAFQAYWLACLTELNRLRAADLQALVDNP